MSIRNDNLKAMVIVEVPADGSAIGNQSLLAALRKQHPKLTEAAFHAARDQLILEGELKKGGGRGGSVSRVLLDDGENEEAADTLSDDIEDDEFELEVQDSPTSGPARRAGKTAKKRTKTSGPAQVLSYRHPDKRANNPEVGMVHLQNDPDHPKAVWKYDPHLDPVLEFDSARANLETLIDDALASGDADKMHDALTKLKRLQEPYLTWSGKAERNSFEVDTVSLHVHERIDPASILAVVRKRLKGEGDSSERALQQGLFDAPFESLPLRQALDFYKHEKNWSNRLIAGDSLLVMNSLLQKESMAGQVQMIYIDPPYGIKYGSNFQPFTNKRDVKDGSDADLTQEPEMIKAFRDTWELGIHSYLTYLRDRLLLAKDLLSASGSVFLQIGDENLHRSICILDEIFGPENRISIITIQKTGGQETEGIPNIADYIVWYARDKDKVKYHQLYKAKESGVGHGSGQRYDRIEYPNGNRGSLTAEQKVGREPPPEGRIFQLTSLISSGVRSNTTGEWEFQGKKYHSGETANWKTSYAGLSRLEIARRIEARKSTIAYVRYIDDFSAYPISNIWSDVAGASGIIYVVQTSA